MGCLVAHGFLRLNALAKCDLTLKHCFILSTLFHTTTKNSEILAKTLAVFWCRFLCSINFLLEINCHLTAFSPLLNPLNELCRLSTYIPVEKLRCELLRTLTRRSERCKPKIEPHNPN